MELSLQWFPCEFGHQECDISFLICHCACLRNVFEVETRLVSLLTCRAQREISFANGVNFMVEYKSLGILNHKLFFKLQKIVFMKILLVMQPGFVWCFLYLHRKDSSKSYFIENKLLPNRSFGCLLFKNQLCSRNLVY